MITLYFTVKLLIKQLEINNLSFYATQIIPSVSYIFNNFLQTIDKFKDLLDKENITYSIDLFYSKEGLQSLDREPFSVCIIC